MELLAEKRDLNGKKVTQLRLNGKVPGVLYSTSSSKGEKAVLNLSLNFNQFKKVYDEAGTSSLVTLHIDGGEAVNALIHEVQFNPMTLQPIHVGLYEVNMKAKIDTEVPVSVINEDKNEAVKAGDGIIISILSTVEVRSLPGDIPHEFEVDAMVLKEVGDVIKVSDLKYDQSKVEMLSDLDEVILKMDFATQLETAEEAAADVSSVEVITEKKAVEGEEGDEKKGEPKEKKEKDD